ALNATAVGSGGLSPSESSFMPLGCPSRRPHSHTHTHTHTQQTQIHLRQTCIHRTDSYRCKETHIKTQTLNRYRYIHIKQIHKSTHAYIETHRNTHTHTIKSKKTYTFNRYKQIHKSTQAYTHTNIFIYLFSNESDVETKQELTNL